MTSRKLRIMAGVLSIIVLGWLAMVVWTMPEDRGRIERLIRDVPFEVQFIGSGYGCSSINQLIAIGGPAVPRLTRGLRSDNSMMIVGCAYILGEIGQPATPAIRALEQAIERDQRASTSVSEGCFGAICKITGDDPTFVELAAELLAAGRYRESKRYLTGQPVELVRAALSGHVRENPADLSATYVSFYLDCGGDPDPLAAVFRDALGGEEDHHMCTVVNEYLTANPDVATRFVSQWLDAGVELRGQLEDRIIDTLPLMGESGEAIMLEYLQSADRGRQELALRAAYRLETAPPELVDAAWQLLSAPSERGMTAAAVIVRHDPQALEKLCSCILEPQTGGQGALQAARALGVHSRELGPKVAPAMLGLLVDADQRFRQDLYQFFVSDYGFDAEIDRLLPEFRELLDSADEGLAHLAFLIVAWREYGTRLTIGNRDLETERAMLAGWQRIAAEDGHPAMRRQARTKADESQRRIAEIEQDEMAAE